MVSTFLPGRNLPKLKKNKALKKDWVVYFSFRNPKTGKLEKQPFIKAGANKLKTKTDRYQFEKDHTFGTIGILKET